MSRQTLSAVIMTKNCAGLVEGALQSVAGWADEIVVIDGFSTDATVDICRRYTDRVFQNRWDGFRFCTERNLGTSKATMDWCLHIDPDERATPEFRAAVTRMLEKGTPHNAFDFKKKNFFIGRFMKHGGWFHYSRHLFRRGRAVYDGIIHERLRVEGTVGRIDAAIEHYPFTSVSQFVTRHNGYSTREAHALQQEHGSPITDREIEYNIRKKPLKRFLKFYLRKRGFMDGMHGFIFSVLFAWVHFINWAKYWEMTHADPHR